MVTMTSPMAIEKHKSQKMGGINELLEDYYDRQFAKFINIDLVDVDMIFFQCF